MNGPEFEAWGDQEAYLKPTHHSDDRYARGSRRGLGDNEQSEKLDLLPRRHVGRRRPQYRVELRLGRRQIVQVGVAKRL